MGCRNSTWWLILIAALAMVLVGCSDERGVQPPADEPQPVVGPKQVEIVTSGNVFGLDLFRQLVVDSPDANVFISPLSVSAALAMTYNGAEGKTKSEMRSTLGFDGLSDQEVNETFQGLFAYLTTVDSTVAVQIANSIFYHRAYSFEQAFLDINREYFDAEVSGLDFSDPNSADIINDWVDEKTHSKITEVVPKPLPTDLVMTLINAIYFKGAWTYQFHDSLTVDGEFYAGNGSSQSVRMMFQGRDMSYFEDERLQMIDLPYGDEKYSMTIILPGLDLPVNELVALLDDQMIGTLVGGLAEREGCLLLPRFKVTYDMMLCDALRALGIRDAFKPYVADFSRMRAANDLYISFVKHKSFIEVNEQGTTAAAVTVVGVAITSTDPDAPFQMVVDRPFVFMIREQTTNTILFIGKVTDLG